MNRFLSEEAYRHALRLLQQGRWDAAREQLLQAAGTGYVPAIKELGILELHGIGGPVDAISAVNRFQQSLQEPEAQFELSRCLYFGYGIQADQVAALHWLKQAAIHGFAEAMRVLAMLARWPGVAPAMPESLAETLMHAAMARGDTFASYLRDNGVLTKPQQTMDKTLLAASIDAIQWPRHEMRPGQKLHDRPAITVFPEVLDPWQCAYIRFRGASHLRPSMVLDPATGQRMCDPVRNSDSVGFDWFLEDMVIHQIMQAVTALADIDATRSEPLHLLRYGEGQEYKPHYDFVGGLEYTGQFAEQQRTDTFCLYLNTVPAGGETAFPRLGMSVPAVQGQVVHFQNVDKEGRPFVDSLHCGQPVTAGEKWLATLWIRKNDTQRGMDYE